MLEMRRLLIDLVALMIGWEEEAVAEEGAAGGANNAAGPSGAQGSSGGAPLAGEQGHTIA